MLLPRPWWERAFPCPLTILKRHSELQHHQVQPSILVASYLLARFLHARPQGVVSPLECVLGLLPVVVEVLVEIPHPTWIVGQTEFPQVDLRHVHGLPLIEVTVSRNKTLHRPNRASGHPLLPPQYHDVMATVFQCLQYTMPIHHVIFGDLWRDTKVGCLFHTSFSSTVGSDEVGISHVASPLLLIYLRLVGLCGSPDPYPPLQQNNLGVPSTAGLQKQKQAQEPEPLTTLEHMETCPTDTSVCASSHSEVHKDEVTSPGLLRFKQSFH